MVPVSDVDRAKALCLDRAGCDLIVDQRAGEDFRVVQVNPPGSPDRRDSNSFLAFCDPDGNGWLVPEVGRAPSAA